MSAIRIKERPEVLEKMEAFEGMCRHCPGTVKMLRHKKTFQLNPGSCYCLSCGQHYFMEIKDIESWERKQRIQKMNRSCDRLEDINA